MMHEEGSLGGHSERCKSLNRRGGASCRIPRAFIPSVTRVKGEGGGNRHGGALGRNSRGKLK